MPAGRMLVQEVVLAVETLLKSDPAAFRDMIDNMCHGGKIALLGIPPKPIEID